MRRLRTVFCSLALLLMVGIGPTAYSADTPHDATTEAWGGARKLCLQNGTSSSRCDALIDALSGKGKPIPLPGSGDTLTDAVNEAWTQHLAFRLIIANSRDIDGTQYKFGISGGCYDLMRPKGTICSKRSIKLMAETTARIESRAKAAIGDKHRSGIARNLCPQLMTQKS